MDEARDYGEILEFSARLRLFAQLQGSYMEVLRNEGFDDDQSFQLLRDWSARAFDWTLRPSMPMAPAPPQFVELDDVSHLLAPTADPSTASDDEPYLLSVDDMERELRRLDVDDDDAQAA